MSTWTARRFWTAATAVPVESGFTVHLDARPVRTPLKAALVLPTLALAEAVAAEWQAQEKTVNPETMPFTRTANSAIDTVMPQFAAVADMLAEYGGSDLLCYRAEGPAALVARQAQSWDPLLDWARDDLGAPLRQATGVMHVAQPEPSLAALRTHVHAMSAYQLAAFHDLVAISGSLVLALAVARGRISADEAWTMSRVDEDWQISLWGEDDEAAEAAARKRAALLQADRFYALCG
ncbi:ATP12 family chaperone protein [Tabrizicola sp.]|uniref:ATP12 family chaperone protein n=1 Tax=Tabrizicola sp. TaxID=2005166 RepID=UPI00273313C7|nr:ATP12 family protein [Tabrizicola sp.]MDP3195287.1 ATP12 family protein [Tabrizicola sp.]